MSTEAQFQLRLIEKNREQTEYIDSQKEYIKGLDLVIQRQQRQMEEMRTLLLQAQAQLAQNNPLNLAKTVKAAKTVKVAILETKPVLYGYVVEQFLNDIFGDSIPTHFEYVDMEGNPEILASYDLALVIEMSRNARCVLENPRNWPLTDIVGIKDRVLSVLRLFVDEMTKEEIDSRPLANLGEGYGGGVFNRTPAEIEASLLFYFTNVIRDGQPRSRVFGNAQNAASREMLGNVIQMISDSKTH